MHRNDSKCRKDGTLTWLPTYQEPSIRTHVVNPHAIVRVEQLAEPGGFQVEASALGFIIGDLHSARKTPGAEAFAALVSHRCEVSPPGS